MTILTKLERWKHNQKTHPKVYIIFKYIFICFKNHKENIKMPLIALFLLMNYCCEIEA